ncbi:hypothetical protein MANES_06G111100v8 [Manihot esculenta]|uniref:Uncharacterized protein n=1 Tax=Manihot esculenta TaxID=3983 RepID=A0ACB7HLN5_MANES|nr:hypothetical protein MANES_06G111100v8 [Manihot esculenta]
MPQESQSEQDPDDSDAEFVEVDPTGRYGRYKEILGRGAFKKVYRAFDELEGIEVAWNQVKVADLLRNAVDLERLYSEVHLLKTLKHKNIIKFYNSWVDTKNENINFITEIFTSGTLRQYRKKHKHVDLRALKKWSRQILEGLSYLHSHDPPVIHRDLKCDNIFVNGNQGTPEFMAPELYEEEYNELVDIYAFGMCLLELVTFDYPYVECANAAQIYKKVTSGIKPASLAKVTDHSVKAFIEKCIANVTYRLPAKELLMDPFLRSDEERSLQFNLHHSDTGDSSDSAERSKDFTVQGQRKNVNTIFLKLSMADSTGKIRNIHFPFDIEVDTAIAVASEMVEELDLTDQDVSTIAAMIDSEIQSHIPNWGTSKFSADNISEEVAESPSESRDYPTINNESTPSPSSLAFERLKTPSSSLALERLKTSSSSLALERLPSGRKYWSDSPRVVGGSSPSRLGHSNSPFHQTSLNNHHDADSQNAASSVVPLESEIGTNVESSDINSVPLNVKVLAEKLEELLVKQQKELDDLKSQHEVAISDLLNEVPPEISQQALNLCKLKMADYKVL